MSLPQPVAPLSSSIIHQILKSLFQYKDVTSYLAGTETDEEIKFAAE